MPTGQQQCIRTSGITDYTTGVNYNFDTLSAHRVTGPGFCANHEQLGECGVDLVVLRGGVVTVGGGYGDGKAGKDGSGVQGGWGEVMDMVASEEVIN